MERKIEDLSVTVTEAPVEHGPLGYIWAPVWWEIRDGGMGESLVAGLWNLDEQMWEDPMGGPQLTELQITEHLLLAGVTPDDAEAVLTQLKEKIA